MSEMTCCEKRLRLKSAIPAEPGLYIAVLFVNPDGSHWVFKDPVHAFGVYEERLEYSQSGNVVTGSCVCCGEDASFSPCSELRPIVKGEFGGTSLESPGELSGTAYEGGFALGYFRPGEEPDDDCIKAALRQRASGRGPVLKQRAYERGEHDDES